jgi:hypothetical protein
MWEWLWDKTRSFSATAIGFEQHLRLGNFVPRLPLLTVGFCSAALSVPFFLVKYAVFCRLISGPG